MEKNMLNRQRLKECRERLSISKREAAKRMHLSQPAYLRYESGERFPSLHVIQTMADVLGTSVEYLTEETDNPLPTSYLIGENTNPDLFYIVDMYKKSDTNTQNRILEYFKKFSDPK